ncbi:MAG: hypothetical protein AAFY41_00735 [Bacteroidota bacterium]
MSKRARLLINVTRLQVEINNLEVKKVRCSINDRQAYIDQLHEKRKDLSVALGRLRSDDEAWIKDQEQKIEVLENQSKHCDAGTRAQIQDEIQEYKSRVVKRKESIKSYG